MKIEEIKELVALLEQSELNVLEVSEGESRIRLEKAAPAPAPVIMGAAAPVMSVATGAMAGQVPGVDSAAAGAGAAGLPGRPEGRAVKSPMVGVFYGAPTPGAAPYVTVGSRVSAGDVLCIVEAMKLMNEIQAEIAGEIVEICAADGDVVEYGQPLFYIK